jgi:CheY-like chemotaxis protein
MTMRARRVVVVDDSEAFARMFRRLLLERYGAERFLLESYGTPLHALAHIDASIDLLLIDLEMPHIDGQKFLDFAVEKGVPRRRIVVTSGRDADILHRLFPSGSCLAVINKIEEKQQEAFRMILDSIMRD